MGGLILFLNAALMTMIYAVNAEYTVSNIFREDNGSK